MVFGLGKNDAAARDAEQYIRTMFAGMHMPNQALGDPYVLAFLQSLVVHASLLVYKGKLPDQLTVAAIMTVALNNIVPRYGIALVKAVTEAGDPSHRLHQNYSIGRREGTEYAQALLAGDQIKSDEMMGSFRAFLTRNYAS